MKTSQIAFNIVALLIAGLCVLSLLSTLFVVMPTVPHGSRGIWYFIISLEAILIVMLGGGGIANFAKGRLAPWPTGTMIAGYCLSMWLLPLAIWGVIALQSERKRQRNEPENATALN
jgi:hypothetical protein